MAIFNIGTDVGKSSHEPKLLQGHDPFGNVKVEFENYYVEYEIGRIAPFSKSGLPGVKYNKLSYNVPLKK